MKENVTATGRALGPLSKLKRHAELTGYSEPTLRHLHKAGQGPPLFKRPGSNRLVGYEGETLDWVESNRPKGQAANSATMGAKSRAVSVEQAV